jgi:leader peptidase (prepilin peptidase)/N-methyltransferase
VIDPTTFYAVCGAVLGACLGSYLGMAVWRIPNRRPLSGRSVCPGCGSPVPSYLNLPIFGFLLLRGRSACCEARLSPWYLLLESGVALCGALAGAFGHVWGLIAITLVVVLGSLLWKLVVDSSSRAR